MALGTTRTSLDIGEMDLDGTVAVIDQALDGVNDGSVTGVEAVESIIGYVGLLLRFGAVDARDVEFGIEYAKATVEEIAEAPAVHDPVLVEYFEQWVCEAPLARELATRLDLLLDRLEQQLTIGTPEAREELVELCRRGHRSHTMTMATRAAPSRVLRTAWTHGVAEALAAAVSPLHAHEGQIANIRSTDSAQLALNLLAQLAADPDRGRGARRELLELARFVQTAGEATVRLPMHLLDDEDRTRLLEIHEERVELFHDENADLPLDLAVVRDNRVVRAAVWQAWDARHIL